MKKYLVNIRFSYFDISSNNRDSGGRYEVITLGVYDDINVACREADKALEIIKSKVDVIRDGDSFIFCGEFFPDCVCLDKGGYDAYIDKPYNFECEIKTLNYKSVSGVVDDIKNAAERLNS